MERIAEAISERDHHRVRRRLVLGVGPIRQPQSAGAEAVVVQRRAIAGVPAGCHGGLLQGRQRRLCGAVADQSDVQEDARQSRAVPQRFLSLDASRRDGLRQFHGAYADAELIFILGRCRAYLPERGGTLVASLTCSTPSNCDLFGAFRPPPSAARPLRTADFALDY